MATGKELIKSGNRFMFRGKKYKFRSYCPVPSIEMVAEDGSTFSFGIESPISQEFVLFAENIPFDDFE